MTTRRQHWMTRYDPDDGEPYGEVCECGLGEDHNAAEYLAYLEFKRRAEEDLGDGHGGPF